MEEIKYEKTLLIISALFSINAFAQVNYIPADLDRFEKTNNCQKCDLSGAYIGNENHPSSVVNGTDFSDAIFTLADLTYLMFSGSNFSRANLSNTNLKYSNFSNCNFDGANISKADLAFTTLYGAKITQEQLKSALSYACAVMPDGSIAPPDHEYTSC